MNKAVAVSSLLILGLASSSLRAQSQEEIAKRFAGMWRLVSNPQHLADGTTTQGRLDVGYAFFDADASHMCFLAMKSDRPKLKPDATAEEQLSALKGFVGYCATIEIHAKEGFLARHYELYSSPNEVGATSKRWYSFRDADHMSLRIAKDSDPPEVGHFYNWERVGK